MKKILAAIALSIAIPSIAQAQAAPAPKMDCCEKMKEKCACCKDMAGKGHEGHDMSGGSKDPHAGHDMTPKAPSPQSNN